MLNQPKILMSLLEWGWGREMLGLDMDSRLSLTLALTLIHFIGATFRGIRAIGI
jgi:hypothetical protein